MRKNMMNMMKKMNMKNMMNMMKKMKKRKMINMIVRIVGGKDTAISL